MPGSLMTSADQLLWSHRIDKELKVNGKNPGGFSLRNCVSRPDVPLKFKSGHVDPSSKVYKELEFDPASIGWEPTGATAKEFRRCINQQYSGPRQRHQFPETSQQEIGWCQAGAGEIALRSGPAGSCPTKLGIGWLQKDGHGGVLAGAVGDAEDDAASVAEPYQRKSKDRNAREDFGVPPYGTTTGAIERNANRKLLAQAERGSDVGATSVVGGASYVSRASGGKSVVRPSAPPSLLSVAAPTQLSRVSSLPELSANPLKRLAHQEKTVHEVLQESRRYLNRHPDNSRYHPLSNSDVATFADAYTKAWGRGLFNKVHAQ